MQGFEWLYLLTGDGHYGGGQGPSQLGLLTPMMAWVEGGTAPDAIMTATTATESAFCQPDGVQEDHSGMPPALDLGIALPPDMTRPVYTWPATAMFSGKGDPTDAANWGQGPDATTLTVRDWAGADFFAPFPPKD